MKVEIWSDIMCPFCYIGKRKFEQALERFEHKDKINVEWKSFQLDPTMPERCEESQEQYLVKKKGFSESQVKGMLQQVTQMANDVGLDYHLDKAIMGNSLRAHRLIQWAKTMGKGDAIEERLFKAYFIDGLDLSDSATLKALAIEIGLPEAKVDQAFELEVFLQMAERDFAEAQQLGISGVPFFVFDRKYGVSGAQAPEVFLNTLNQSFQEWSQGTQSQMSTQTDGPSCDANGQCE